MKVLTLSILLLARVAFAQIPPQVPLETLPSDRPYLAEVKSGEAVVVTDEGERIMILPPGAFLNDKGMRKMESLFKEAQLNLVDARAQNEALRKRVDELAAEPTLNIPVVIAIAAGALVVGAGTAVGITLAVKR